MLVMNLEICLVCAYHVKCEVIFLDGTQGTLGMRTDSVLLKAPIRTFIELDKTWSTGQIRVF